ncbi:Trm112p-domain-containing protein [Melanomma pulvis-pyrius CBS 109.77]|uniref:Trm112p-domain-containing protein n=1 Tax=Melanomma pulvis-pyrius CBS 109.77 TaxID=1314802 RepID=A0A6A6XCM0_9PLEO|nr:Trm112p-domain-containing protein [Melanomma pulvis-pyrius CBS 109.77]
MKLLTLNFLTCAIKTCKSSPASFPLHPRDAELEVVEADLNLAFLKNILPRLMWDELRVIASELGLPALPETPPSKADLSIPSPTAPAPATTLQLDPEAIDAPENPPVVESDVEEETPSQTAVDLHRILLETCITEGKLVCGNCGHEYAVKEGVANFLLPGHLV